MNLAINITQLRKNEASISGTFPSPQKLDELYCLLEKVTRFTGFLAGHPVYLKCVPAANISPLRIKILQLFSLMSCITVLMSIVEVFI